MAAHYGSVSVVTFAVGAAYLANLGQDYEGYMVVFLVLLEFPALMIGVWLARRGQGESNLGKVLHEVFAGKSIVLLVGGLLIGWLAGADGPSRWTRCSSTCSRACWRFSCSKWGLVAASRIGDLRRAGTFLLGFAVVMPLFAGTLGALTASLLGLSVGGAALLATLYASASYIAAPAAMRIAVPEANPALSIGAALGITFPFNLVIGIPAYYWLASQLQGVL